MNIVAPLSRSTVASPQAAHPRGRRRIAAELAFRRRGGRSFLARQHTPHPFHLTRPFYLPGDPAGMATLYLQSSSGGLYGDDDLSLNVALEEGTAAHVTTQASTIVHAARGGTTRQSVTLDCARDSLLEYLPDPLILFSSARIASRLTARLGRGATLVFTDAFLGHDPGTGGSGTRADSFEAFDNDIVVHRHGEPLPLLIERQRLTAADWPPVSLLPDAVNICHGSLCVVADGPCEPVAEAVKRQLVESGPSPAACYAGVNALPERGLVWARFLCGDGGALSRALAAAWRGARLALTGAPPPLRNK